MGVQGARLPAGARGVPALSLFPNRLADDALGRRGSVVGKRNTENGSIVAGLDNKDVV